MTDTIHLSSSHTSTSSTKYFFSELAKIMNKTSVHTCTHNTGTHNTDTPHKNIIISSDNSLLSKINDTDGGGTVDSNDISDENICLISKEKLHPNHITLSCKHKFNYIPIFKEISYQKNKSNTSFEITKLSHSEIKCPYCRRITNKLLPYIPYPSVKQLRYVNSPDELCMSAMKCQHTHKCKNPFDVDVDNTDVKCDKNALYYETENVLFCVQHFRQYENRMKSIEDKKAKEYAKIQEKKAERSLLPHCKSILKSGKNIGKPCDRIISVQGASVCKIHSS
jgi:hypothetical protein